MYLNILILDTNAELDTEYIHEDILLYIPYN